MVLYQKVKQSFNSVRDADKVTRRNICVGVPCRIASRYFFARMVLKMSSKIIIDTQTLTRTLARLAHEIIEHSEGYEEVYLVGIKRRGVPLAKMLKTNIESFSNLKVHLGELDITLYRDDLSEKYSSPQLNGTQIDFDVTNKNIILVDDVLFTGRTARAAMDAIIKLGRPAKIQLAVIIDRGHFENFKIGRAHV